MGLGTQGAGCNGAAVGLHNKGLQLGYLKDTPVAAKEFNAKKHGFKMLGKDFVDVSCQLPFPSVWDIG